MEIDDMQSIILICSNEEFLKDIFEQYNDTDVYKLYENNRFNIESDEGRIYITLDNSIINDYADGEVELIKNIFDSEMFFYLINYSDNQALFTMIMKTQLESLKYIDDDKGSIVPFFEYKMMLVEERENSRFSSF